MTMTDPVQTIVETDRPFFHVHLVDGRISLLQFSRIDERLLDEFLANCRDVLSRALQQHARDRTAEIMERFGSTPDPHRDRVMAHVAERLDAASEHEPLPQRRWFPEQADGRDPSGEVHVSVTATRVVLLETPFAALEHPGKGARAIMAATNLALERLDDDVAAHVHGRLDRARRLPEPDWEAMALMVERLRRGYI